MIGVLDYGLGNLVAVQNILVKSGIKHSIVSTPIEKSNSYSSLILPGVGAFDAGIRRLRSTSFDEFILDEAKRGTNIVGLCLGMHLLFDRSEEGTTKGLALIPGTVRKLSDYSNIVVPNCGWRTILSKDSNKSAKTLPRAYFNHSFGVLDSQTQYATSVLEKYLNICASVQKDNIFGFQFHPERSYSYGESIFKRLSRN
jgi:glutamine amidotransferase